MSPEIRRYLSSVRLLSDQVDKEELGVILTELNQVLARSVDGDVVELGCYTGTTSVHLATLLQPTTKTLYLYDSFEGLPPKTKEDSSPAGLQFQTGELHATKRQLLKNFLSLPVRSPVVTKGWFSELSPTQLPETICFAFLDGDYYESIRDSLRLVWPKLTPGAVVVVDDYMNEALPGAARAVDEWMKDHSGTLRAQHSLGIIHT